MIVYVVNQCSDSRQQYHSVVAVYSSREAAEQCLERYAKADSIFNHYIEEFELDKIN